MTASEIERIRAAAIENGRRERREQGIPERVESPELTARIAALLRGARSHAEEKKVALH